MRTSWRRVIQGLAFLVVIALLLGVSVATFQRKIFNEAEVPAILRVDHAGTQLGPDADVKIRGIVVGRVASQSTDGETATLSLRLLRKKIRYVPRNVRARLLPKTLFGEKFVDLVIPASGAAAEPVRSGQSIPQDTSLEALEVERVLADLFPLLRALRPERLNAALTAIADGLQGRGNELGRSLANLDAYLSKINPELPTIQHDLSGLADLAESLDANAADLLRIARNSIVSGQTLTSKADTFSAFLRGTAGFADTMTSILQTNGDDLIYLADATRQTLATIYPKRDVLPGTVKGLNELLTKLNEALNHGPALAIRLEPVKSRGGYDVPCSYPDEHYQGGCPIGTGTLPPPGPTVLGATALGQPGSPQERDAIRTLLAPDMGVAPADVPDLAVLLLAPVLRGTLVSAS
jgi:virulence factor Mce-like protein